MLSALPRSCPTHTSSYLSLSPIDAEGSGTRKKEAERECSIDACRKLDAAGLLRGEASALDAHKKQKMKALLGEDDSDEDTFYDRTGTSNSHSLYLFIYYSC